MRCINIVEVKKYFKLAGIISAVITFLKYGIPYIDGILNNNSEQSANVVLNWMVEAFFVWLFLTMLIALVAPFSEKIADWFRELL